MIFIVNLRLIFLISVQTYNVPGNQTSHKQHRYGDEFFTLNMLQCYLPWARN
jgi:hypothetical protein